MLFRSLEYNSLTDTIPTVSFIRFVSVKELYSKEPSTDTAFILLYRQKVATELHGIIPFYLQQTSAF